jgi:spore protease
LTAAVVERIRPVRVIAIDALAARETARLCRAIQISNTGIVPGSGVGNARSALTRETLGVPVVAVGIPTVVDAATLCADLGGRPAPEGAESMFVTPRDIDARVRIAARLAGYGVNLALQDGLTISDVDMLLS